MMTVTTQAQGAIVGSAGIARDITERIESEQLVRRVLEAAPDAMIIADATGSIVLVNSMTESMFGYSRNELARAGALQSTPGTEQCGRSLAARFRVFTRLWC